jgi:trans-aconitate methyltransferase
MTFSAQWLALREPYDQSARSGTVLNQVAAAFAGRPEISVVDLGCGTGSTVRSVGPRLPARQRWSTMTSVCWRTRPRWRARPTC